MQKFEFVLSCRTVSIGSSDLQLQLQLQLLWWYAQGFHGGPRVKVSLISKRDLILGEDFPRVQGLSLDSLLSLVEYLLFISFFLLFLLNVVFLLLGPSS